MNDFLEKLKTLATHPTTQSLAFVVFGMILIIVYHRYKYRAHSKYSAMFYDVFDNYIKLYSMDQKQQEMLFKFVRLYNNKMTWYKQYIDKSAADWIREQEAINAREFIESPPNVYESSNPLYQQEKEKTHLGKEHLRTSDALPVVAPNSEDLPKEF